ncbi:hypothetical protein QCA50_010748 [Cerrena zonata]|uniref:DUF6570 domain-containing protein n=1 Tax=Cerrena zonata TaxID=2478898 RepID=A0AAW0G3P5_9APHY
MSPPHPHASAAHFRPPLPPIPLYHALSPLAVGFSPLSAHPPRLCSPSLGVLSPAVNRSVLHSLFVVPFAPAMGDVLRRSRLVQVSYLSQFPVLHGSLSGLFDGDVVTFIDVALAFDTLGDSQLSIQLPFLACSRLPVKDVRRIASLHNVVLPRGTFSQSHVVNPFGRILTSHPPAPPPPAPFRFPSSTSFPPAPASLMTQMEIIREWTAATSGLALAEVACAVPVDDPLFLILRRLDVSVAVCERVDRTTLPQVVRSPILERAGIVVSNTVSCCNVCPRCKKSLDMQNIPPRSLANGLWIGDIAMPLVILNYCERIIVARFRHNAFVIAVQMGQRRMRANAITFSQPIAKVYTVLPPPREEIDDCLAILFTGPCAPTPADLKRTPFLVSHRRVWNALLWLAVNHSDYHDITLSRSNLQQYTDNAAPVSIIYRPRPQTENCTAPETLAVFDDGEEVGTDDGPCSFAVHALTSDTLDGLS